MRLRPRRSPARFDCDYDIPFGGRSDGANTFNSLSVEEGYTIARTDANNAERVMCLIRWQRYFRAGVQSFRDVESVNMWHGNRIGGHLATRQVLLGDAPSETMEDR